MAFPVQITFRDIDPSDAIEARIFDRVKRLEKFAGRATGLNVTVAAPHQSGHKGKIYQFTLELRMPKDDIVVRQGDTPNHAHEDVYVALRDAFAALERQVHDHVAKRGP
ncbi:MAG: HPF/RaiA family ribosome-associated protein [Alphaproteobacteria bacterium]|nr:HPF/RaiA family ribosome-associated protein [Alphaproteobacteria bacterium]